MGELLSFPVITTRFLIPNAAKRKEEYRNNKEHRRDACRSE